MKLSNKHGQWISLFLGDKHQEASSSTPFPFKELARQGVNIKEIVISSDMNIPTNTTSPTEGIIVLQTDFVTICIPDFFFFFKFKCLV